MHERHGALMVDYFSSSTLLNRKNAQRLRGRFYICLLLFLYLKIILYLLIRDISLVYI